MIKLSINFYQTTVCTSKPYSFTQLANEYRLKEERMETFSFPHS